MDNLSIAQKKLLSIIIVNYNGCCYLEKCLPSIEKACYSLNYEIIIVDNNSTDGSLEYIRQNHTNVCMIRNTENLGFAKGNNIGVQNSSGKFLLLLNNDTVINSPIGPLIDVLLADSSVGALSIKMLGKDGEYRLSAGYFPNVWRYLKISLLYKRNQGFADGSMPNELYKVDWVEASLLLTTRAAWGHVNGMDDSLFMYGEDIDYCKRLRDIGLRTVYLTTSQYIHLGGYNRKREEWLLAGFKRYNQKHFSSTKRIAANISLHINHKLKTLMRHAKEIYTKTPDSVQ